MHAPSKRNTSCIFCPLDQTTVMTSKSQANGRENAGAWSSQQHLWIFDFETWTKIYGSISHHQHPYIMKHKAGTCIVTQPHINTVPTANSHLTSPFTCSRWIINSLSQSNCLQNTLAHFPTFCWRSVLCNTKLLWILRVRRVGKLRKRKVVSRIFRVKRFGCNHLVHSHVLEWALARNWVEGCLISWSDNFITRTACQHLCASNMSNKKFRKHMSKLKQRIMKPPKFDMKHLYSLF